MPAGPDETDNHTTGAGTEHVARDGSSKTESNASTHPMHQTEPPKAEQVQFRYHEANPGPAGPVVPDNFEAKQEGSKEDRQVKAQELNK